MTFVDNKIIGQSKPATELKKMIGLIANSNSPVIINGNWVRKRQFAEAIQENVGEKSFVAPNCTAIQSELMERNKLGSKGAFTGALKATVGKFEQANEGHILDEIGDMPKPGKLLRVLENL